VHSVQYQCGFAHGGMQHLVPPGSLLKLVSNAGVSALNLERVTLSTVSKLAATAENTITWAGWRRDRDYCKEQ
jgi:hypothetical protein